MYICTHIPKPLEVNYTILNSHKLF